MRKLFLVYLIAILTSFNVSCINDGSEIGNPVNPFPDSTIDSTDTHKYISIEELEVLDRLGDSLDLEELKFYRDSAKLDSMILKAFNSYYFDKK